LEINVALDYPKAANLNNWTCLAVRKQVSRTELINLYRYSAFSNPNKYEFPDLEDVGILEALHHRYSKYLYNKIIGA
jgi:hypothetical protein